MTYAELLEFSRALLAENTALRQERDKHVHDCNEDDMTRRMLEILDELMPPIPRGHPHHMMRERQRSAFKVGYMRGFNDGRHGVPKTRRTKDVTNG